VNFVQNEYITDQLIPYIGNKRKLLDLIGQAIGNTGIASGTFFDAFSGSTVVARLAKSMGYRVLANDWEPYSHIIAKACIRNNRYPDFKHFGGIESAIQELNALTPMPGYIARNYCPEDDEHYDPDTERMFYTQENGRRIDTIREKIDEWSVAGLLDDGEEALLLSSLIFQAAYCSNTSGVFKGFHRGWGGATKTAWYRIRSILTLKAPILFDNQLDNEAYKADALSLVDELECDIAYLDPPYNQHQYSANYHLLNTIGLWDKPAVTPSFEPGKSGVGKAAIRHDWRDRRSAYCSKSTAMESFQGLINKLKARFILVSYSTDGLMPLDDVLKVMAERGRLSVVTRKYKRYRVSSQRPSHKSHNVEFVAIIDTNKVGQRDDIKKVTEQVNAEYI